MANRIYSIANAMLVLGALFVLVGTIAAIYSGGIRERFSDERIARNEAQTATANARAAEADQRAAEARLELEKYRLPRTLTIEQQNIITEKLKTFGKVRFDAAVIRNDAETYHLLDIILPALEAAGWTQIDWKDEVVMKRPNKRDVGEWAATNVIIAVPHDLISSLGTAAASLASALTAEGIPAQAQDSTGMLVKNNDVLHLLVGRKL